MDMESIQGAEITVGDEPDFYQQAWRGAQLPMPVWSRLEQIDRRTNAAMVLSEMLGAHVRGKSDEAVNQGVKYQWLTDRQAYALCDALRDLTVAAVEDLEWIREEAGKEGAKP
ncbi:hypothetical protein [Lysobacter terrae]